MLRQSEHRVRRRQWPHRLIISVLMVAGAIVFVLPVAQTFLNGAESAERSVEYEQQIDAAPQEELLASYAEAEEYNQAMTDEALLRDPWGDDPATSSPAQMAYKRLLSGADAMGRVLLPRVKIDLPIYHGTDKATLLRGAGHIYGTSLPVGGESTHSAIAAHTGFRAHTYFDRLPEVRQGDVFHLDVAGGRLSYEVDQILYVLPHEIDHIRVVPGADLVTLITCWKPPENAYRLLVRGHRIPTVPVANDVTSGMNSPDSPGPIETPEPVETPV
ncbi:MAG: class C sortase, partial [Propionibacteriaceae bacterium]|nr:class C sortase [Propionibacteriaceae bacterium]